jgi:tetratricopeptide (TPR) repeat protein
MLVGSLSSAPAQTRCPVIKITRTLHAPTVTDLTAAVRAEVGPGARPVEWAEVKACYQVHGLDFFRRVGVVKADPANIANPVGSQVLVLVNGNRYFQPQTRAYFAAFHEGSLPRDWLVHDQVGGNQISLGSFSHRLPAFYTLDVQAATSHPADFYRCTGDVGDDEKISVCGSVIAGTTDAARLAAAHQHRAVAYVNKGEFARAIADFDQSIKRDATSALAFNNRGIAWQRKGELDRAIADHTEAIRLDPKDNAGAYRFRSQAWRAKGDADRAIADATQAIRLFPDYNAAFTERGLAYEKKGDIERARADYHVALAMPPKYASGAEAQAIAKAQLAALDKAAAALRPTAPAGVTTAAPAGDKAAVPGFNRRVALVIGNGDYRVANRLPNPANDAADIAAALRKLGFDVVEGRNLDRRGFDDAIRTFGRKLDGADLALFFYAGHGLQVGGKNYLVPIDAKLERPGDLALDAVDVGTVLAQMESEKRVNLLFLDACRDNPLARSLARSLGTRSASVGTGLASIQSAIGTMIAYATQPDNVALDGEGRNSPFTTALLKHIAAPGADIGTVMRRVRADVIIATKEKQVPWDHSSLVGEVVLAR